ncbi:LPS assembly lipoprotein LptE [Falsigemmobacter intermedius]|uniref:LPS assembly lipoprotein LptE n=1 Tax=Falsigemmobacter intermedius TaxID=1553448 RepID=UPI003EFBC850
MWSSDRRKFLVLLAAAPVAACGFSPAMAPGGAAHALWQQVQIDDPVERNGFNYVTRLEERLGRATGPRFRLSWTLRTEAVGAAVTPSGAITRYSLIGRVTYSLTRIEGGQTVASGNLESFTSFDSSGSTLASVTAERDAYERLAVILADQTTARLMAAAPK